MKVTAYIDAPLKADVDSIHRQESGKFGSGFYLHNQYTRKPKSVQNYSDQAVFTATVSNPFIVSADTSAAEALRVDSEAVPLLTSLYGNPDLARGLLDNDGNLGQLIERTLKDQGFDSIIAYHGNEQYELVVFDKECIKKTPYYELPSGYEITDFATGIEAAAEASKRMAIEAVSRRESDTTQHLVVQADSASPMRMPVIMRTNQVVGSGTDIDSEFEARDQDFNDFCLNIAGSRVHNIATIVSPREVRVVTDAGSENSLVANHIKAVEERSHRILSADVESTHDEDNDYQPPMNMIM